MPDSVYAIVLEHADTLCGGAVAVVEAQRLFDRLVAERPDDLAAMLHDYGPFLFAQIIRDRLRSVRAHRGMTAAAAEFEEAAAEFGAGAITAGEFLGTFAIPHRVSPDGAVKRAGEMTGSDHLFVSERYGESAKTFKLRAAVHAAVAKRIGDRRTDEVYTEAEYAALIAGCP